MSVSSDTRSQCVVIMNYWPMPSNEETLHIIQHRLICKWYTQYTLFSASNSVCASNNFDPWQMAGMQLQGKNHAADAKSPHAHPTAVLAWVVPPKKFNLKSAQVPTSIQKYPQVMTLRPRHRARGLSGIQRSICSPSTLELPTFNFQNQYLNVFNS